MKHMTISLERTLPAVYSIYRLEGDVGPVRADMKHTHLLHTRDLLYERNFWPSMQSNYRLQESITLVSIFRLKGNIPVAFQYIWQGMAPGLLSTPT